MNPWEFFGLSLEEFQEEMEALGWEADIDALDNKLDKFFAKAEGVPRSAPCRHEWVNVGFTSLHLVCKKCDKEKS